MADTNTADRSSGQDEGGTCDPFPPQGRSTQHTLNLATSTLPYVAEADWISLRKIHKPVAHVFYTAYLAEPEADPTRPLTFVFNGGPGAASAYLHMGALGPRRVVFGQTGELLEPPACVVENQDTWLPFTDLVFVDPVGTGFSRALQDENRAKKSGSGGGESSEDGPTENADYWEIEKDLDSLGEFISRFLSKHHRWTSPLFIAGESYGGFRVARMARRIQEQHGVGLCGAMMISPAIEFDSLQGSDYNLTHWVELFPSLVAAAHQHGRGQEPSGDGSPQAVLRDGEAFARNELTRLLTYGEALPEDERQDIVAGVSRRTGLSTTVIDRSGGRITATTFCRELLRDRQLLCGRYDASVTAVDPFPDRNDYEGPDPTLLSIDRVFTSAVNHQLRSVLEVETDLDYRLLSRQVSEAWKDQSEGRFYRALVGAMDDLRYGMSLNSHMKVFISHGLFDLVTPYFSSQRLIHLMKLTPAQKQNLVTRSYRGGHMFYTWDESRREFRTDARRLYGVRDTSE